MPHPLQRRDFLRFSTGVGAGLLLGSEAAAADEPRRPNVVMIVSDDQGWPDFGFMGHDVIRTPRLDRLAAESAVFPKGYVPASLCRASLATLLTGLYPHQHHICCNDPPAGVDRSAMHPFMRNAPSLPRLLGTANYRSLQTGKFWEGHFSNAGFTDGQTTNRDRHIAQGTPQIGRTTMQPIFDFIDRNRAGRFFVWYAPMMPHLPHTPPQRILSRYAVPGCDIRLARYFAMCEWFDETCGQLLDHLDRCHLREQTLVTFCVDNGWVQPTGGAAQAGAVGGPRGKRSPYDMGIRTPLLLRWPDHTRAGRYEDLVITIDLAPTILRACGVQVPQQMQGVNLLAAAAGRGRLQRDAIFGEIYTHTGSRLGCPPGDITHRWVRQGDWKLIVPTSPRESVELFNLTEDPHERTNLAARQPERVRQVRQLLDRWVGQR